ncbi:ABC transporter substrate-binding protein [Paraburkholderia tropica]|uniref:ABC transporter substrate-binding protein n=1 Tax=Paraburkholderia tropica TaxID=92647 RepID=UPI002AB08BEA|nr:ABC transporter substrate-binding protein [Paraburkholderia tropica]
MSFSAKTHRHLWSRRDVLRDALALVAVGFGLPAWSVAATSDLAGVTLHVADIKGADEGFFAAAGVGDTPYRLQPVRLSQASLASEALNARAYDLSFESNIASLFLPGRTPVRLAGFVGFRPEAFKVYVRPGRGIGQMSQIRGRRIAYMRGGPLHLFLLEILRHEGLTLSDIQPVALSALDSAAAYQSGDIDVVLAGMFAPSYQIEQAGAHLLATGADFPAFAQNNGMSVATYDEELTDPLKREAIKDYLQRLVKTWHWLDQHEDIWSKEMATLFGVPPEFIIRHRPRLADTRILSSAVGRERTQHVAQVFVAGGAIPGVPLMNRLWDPVLESLLPAI